MPEAIRSVFIVTKADNPRSQALGQEVEALLEERGIASAICMHLRGDEPCMGLVTHRQYDLALILGGDGTFIAAARKLRTTEIPLLGVNLGQVGFLTELCPENWRQSIVKVLDGDYTISPRMLLSYVVKRGGAVLHEGTAVNDIVISRGKLARLVRLGFSCDGKEFTSMRSDGIIVSTPTGSTAYCVSAGGPLLVPGVEAFSLVPICPFLHGFKSLVFPADMTLDIQVQGDCGDVFITEDGQGVVDLDVGDVVTVKRCAQKLLLAETPSASYFQRLKTKGFLLEK